MFPLLFGILMQVGDFLKSRAALLTNRPSASQAYTESGDPTLLVSGLDAPRLHISIIFKESPSPCCDCLSTENRIHHVPTRSQANRTGCNHLARTAVVSFLLSPFSGSSCKFPRVMPLYYELTSLYKALQPLAGVWSLLV